MEKSSVLISYNEGNFPNLSITKWWNIAGKCFVQFYLALDNDHRFWRQYELTQEQFALPDAAIFLLISPKVVKDFNKVIRESEEHGCCYGQPGEPVPNIWRCTS